LTDSLLFARFAGFLGASVAGFRVDGQGGRLEERLDTLWLLVGILGAAIREKADSGILERSDVKIKMRQ
jgi:hypothetical protein